MRHLRPVLALALVLLCLAAPAAFAADNSPQPYLEAKFGSSYTQVANIRHTTDMPNPPAVNETRVEGAVGAMGVAAGLNLDRMGLPLRVELEYAYRTKLAYNPNPTFIGGPVATRANSDLDSHTLFTNLYYDFKTGTAFTPYVGAGLGAAWNHTKSTGTVIPTGTSITYERTVLNLAWNAGLGCAYSLTDNWRLSLGYRFVDFGTAKWGNRHPGDPELTSDDVTGHEVLLGLRYQF